MTSILTFIKRRWREILLVGSIATIAILLPLTGGHDTGGKLTSELTAIAESLDAGLESISRYEDLAEENAERLERFQNEIIRFKDLSWSR